MPVSFKATGFPSLPLSKRRGIWRANLPWNDRRSHIELLILIMISLRWPTKRRQSYCTMSQRFGSLLMAIQALGKIGTDRGIAFRSIPGVNRALHWYQEFTFKAEYAYDYGMPQWLARLDHIFAPLQLEKLFLGRHKVAHFRVWYRDELSRDLKGDVA